MHFVFAKPKPGTPFGFLFITGHLCETEVENGHKVLAPQVSIFEDEAFQFSDLRAALKLRREHRGLLDGFILRAIA